MNCPKMIIFDYGQTLVNEIVFDGLRGTEAVIREATNGSHMILVEEIQALADELNHETRRFGVDTETMTPVEVHNHLFQNYLYEYFGIQLTKTPQEVERIFQNAASNIEPTKNILDLLQFLNAQKIRTAVISNISFSGQLLSEIICRHIPQHNFEFIIASSEYVFRKPHKRIYELALRKAGLKPHEVWYCGDNAVYDVDGAAAAGIFPVWYKGAIEGSNKLVPTSKHLQIDDWNELIQLLNTSFSLPTAGKVQNIRY